MMDANEMYEAVLDALTDRAEKQEGDAPRKTVGIILIQPFDAKTIDEEPVRGIGVITYEDMDDLDFVVLKTLTGGEIIPTTERSLSAVEQKNTTWLLGHHHLRLGSVPAGRNLCDAFKGHEAIAYIRRRPQKRAWAGCRRAITAIAVGRQLIEQLATRNREIAELERKCAYARAENRAAGGSAR